MVLTLLQGKLLFIRKESNYSGTNVIVSLVYERRIAKTLLAYSCLTDYYDNIIHLQYAIFVQITCTL
jgi:hypothetical protein